MPKKDRKAARWKRRADRIEKRVKEKIRQRMFELMKDEVFMKQVEDELKDLKNKDDYEAYIDSVRVGLDAVTKLKDGVR